MNWLSIVHWYRQRCNEHPCTDNLEIFSYESLPQIAAFPDPALLHPPHPPPTFPWGLSSASTFPTVLPFTSRSVYSGWGHTGMHAVRRVCEVTHRRCSTFTWVYGAQLAPVLGVFQVRDSADQLPGKDGPKASWASTLVAQRATNTFLLDSLNCSDRTGMEEIRSLAWCQNPMRNSHHMQGKNPGSTLRAGRQGSPQYSGQAQIFSNDALLSRCLCDWAVFTMGVKSQPGMRWGVGGNRGMKGRAVFPAPKTSTWLA